MIKVDPSTARWLRDKTNGLKPFWYECSQLPTSMKGKKPKAKRQDVDLVEQSKVIDERPQELGALVAKFQMDGISSDGEILEESDDNNDTDFASKSDSSDSDRSNGLYILDEYINHYHLDFCFLIFP